MHGVSEVIVIVLILMITAAMASLAFMFFSETASSVSTTTSSVADSAAQVLSSSMTIEGMAANTVYVRNNGKSDLKDFSVFVNDAPAGNFTNDHPTLRPGETAIIKINDFLWEGDKVTVSTPNGYQYVYADPCKSAALCLHFDEEAGPRTYDSSMHDNNVSIGTNIIPNSDFESGLWISGAQWLLDSGYSGYGARLNNSNSYCNDYQYKDLTVTQNKSYSIGAWIKTNEVQSGFYAAVGIAVPPAWTYFQLSSTHVSGTSNWTWVTMPSYSSGTNSSLRFFATEQHCSPPNTLTAWFDDIYAGYDIPTWANGKNGGALSFDGTDDIVTVLNSKSVNISGSEITVEAWIYPRNPTAGYTHFIRKETPGFGFWLLPTGRLYGEIYHPGWNTGEGYTGVTGNTVLQANRWYRVAMVYKQNEYFKIFLNGTQDGVTVAGNKQIGTSASNLIIGYAGWMGSNNAFFNGTIDEVRIYNRALY